MKSFTLIPGQNCARWIFIFGVLVGLFFSGGEGIQLLPFPNAENNFSKNTSFILEKKSNAYAFSVHGSGKYSTLLKSKCQKHAHQNLAGENLTFDRADFRANFCWRTAQHRHEPDFLQISLVLSSQSDRAPPKI